MRWLKYRPSDSLRTSYIDLLLCIGAYFAIRFSQVIIGPLVPFVINEFEASRGDIGLAITGMWVGYALLQLPSGVFADRYREHRIVLIALGISTIAAIGLAGASTLLKFSIAAVCLGIGAGIYYNPATVLITREFDEIGWVIGAHRIGGQIAGILAPLVAAMVGVRLGWRLPIILSALLTTIVAGFFLWKHRPSPSVQADTSLKKSNKNETLLTVLIRANTQKTTFMMAVVEFVGITTMALLPLFLVERHEFSIWWANFILAVFFTISAIFQPLSGRLSDQIGRDTTIAILSAAGVFGYGTLIATNSFYSVFLAIILAGSALSITPVLQARMMDGLNTTNYGKGFGLFRTQYLLIGSTGTAVVGTTADVIGWVGAFGLLAILWGGILLLLGFGILRTSRYSVV